MTISISWCCRAESDFNAFYTVQSYFWFSLAQIQIISYFVRITKEQKWDTFSLTKIKISSVTAWLSNDASIRNVEVLLFPLVTAQVRKTRQVWNQLLPCCVVYVWTLRALLQYGLTWSLCQLSAPHSPASSLVSGAERKKISSEVKTAALLTGFVSFPVETAENPHGWTRCYRSSQVCA